MKFIKLNNLGISASEKLAIIKVFINELSLELSDLDIVFYSVNVEGMLYGVVVGEELEFF